MTLKEAEKRIEQLEAMVRELQMRPTYVFPLSQPSPLAPQQPYYNPCMPPYIVTCTSPQNIC